jgi:hypothetical protein
MSRSRRVASHSNADPGGVVGLDEPRVIKTSDTSGHRSSSCTRIFGSNAVNPGVSPSSGSGQNTCSREVPPVAREIVRLSYGFSERNRKFLGLISCTSRAHSFLWKELKKAVHTPSQEYGTGSRYMSVSFRRLAPGPAVATTAGSLSERKDSGAKCSSLVCWDRPEISTRLIA